MISGEEKVLELVKNKCPEALRCFLPSDNLLKAMIKILAARKRKELK